MKKIRFRNLLAGLSFTTAFFVFQACYGTPSDFGMDVLIEGKVTSAQNGAAIQGIKVSVPNESQSVFTDTEGNFSFYTIKEAEYYLQFQDIDGDENGKYKSQDTLIEIPDSQTFVNIKLEKAE